MIDKKSYDSKEQKYFEYDRNELLPFLPSNFNNVLDIGCSQGAFGKLLKHKYLCEVYGIEPHQDSAKIAEERLDKVYNTFISDELNLNRRFDLITMNDVLEHFTDPTLALDFVKRHLSPRGYFFASIPNIRCIVPIIMLVFKKDWKYEKSGIMDETHYKFYTKKSVLRLLDDHGFKVDYVGFENLITHKYAKLVNKLTFGLFEELLSVSIVVRAQINRYA